MSKYNFDKIIDRKCTNSSKWAKDGWTKQIMGGELPEDRICLHVADMDFECAPEIVEAMHKVASEAIYGYTSIPNDYYEAVINWYDRRMNWKINKDSIYYVPGTHTGIAKIILNFTKPNEGVIVLTPSYNYHGDIDDRERKFVGVEMINNCGYYTIDYKALEQACKDENNTCMIICHPHNPTGRVYTVEELNKIAKICRENNVLMISDEVHSDLIRKDVEFVPMMKAVGSEGLIACTALNKTFNIAGLQMTNMIIEDPKFCKNCKNMYDSPTPFGVASVIAAYNECEEWVDELNEYLESLIDDAIEYINKNINKCKVYRPEGTYVLWLDFRGYNLSDEEIRQRIYNNARVVAQGGKCYDEKDKEQFQRICISSPRSVIMEALERIAKEFK